ncbi:MAG: hypothetical protein LIO79_09125 [Rikenellaceae bacterium]|nr:hypothetical protein [Rikenellaceae bacterium]
MRLIPLVLLPTAAILFSCNKNNEDYIIDRPALVKRNNVTVTQFDTLSSLSIGNGKFTFTVDATGLQSFPEYYKNGIPLGTMSQWGWHSFPNPENLRHDETLRNYDFRGREEPYSVQYKDNSRSERASEWYRINPHRLHLGYVGLEMDDNSVKITTPETIDSVYQYLDMWTGKLSSHFYIDGKLVETNTVCSPYYDLITTYIKSDKLQEGTLGINLRFPYPTGAHSDDASNWDASQKHLSEIIELTDNQAVIKRVLDDASYYVFLFWQGDIEITKKEEHYFVINTNDSELEFTVLFSPNQEDNVTGSFARIEKESADAWKKFWVNGAAVDFSLCKDPRAQELERRVVLSQYLTAIQNAGDVPPAETGLTYNSWFGRPHLEMHWWHGVHFALWDRADILERSMPWYIETAMVPAKEIASRQHFDGVRWMKMTDNWANEAPSNVGSFLIWQQPHFIYFAELLYRDNNSPELLEKYKEGVLETARFMASFMEYDGIEDRYILRGYIPAQETLRASETINSPFELSYWHWGLSTAQLWRERLGMGRDLQWDIMIDKLSYLAAKDGKYLAAEDALDTYTDIRFTSDHMIVLGSYGMLPKTPQFTSEIMKNTFDWIWDNWNWGKTWGWDYPMTAMCAARLGMPDKAVDALLMDKRTNTYLPNGHNFQDNRLRIYLPGNGGLLTAVAMMCAGWDGCGQDCPGFPQNGEWDVKWEGLHKMP